MNKKGQSALEAAFVVLFIATAILGIFLQTIQTNDIIGETAKARAVAQGVALELSMQAAHGGSGDVATRRTHLVRIDRNAEEQGIDVYAASHDCEGFYQTLSDAYTAAEISLTYFRCSEYLYDGIGALNETHYYER